MFIHAKALSTWKLLVASSKLLDRPQRISWRRTMEKTLLREGFRRIIMAQWKSISVCVYINLLKQAPHNLLNIHMYSGLQQSIQTGFFKKKPKSY